ncbi:hypothetical protein LCGC14_0401630 [marine sediment metagenome]|uniref:Uncharacterized protein n=1 Tax=marine sediment metagenome TaxID=412755 RepID=A0A0F9SWT0_9ZZZZ
MSKTNNYDRPKLSGINDTGMDMTLLVGEKPDAPSAIGGTGSTAELDCRVQADADESGGADVQDLYKIEVLPAVALSGAQTVKITVTPIKGDASEGTPQIITVTHPENMDAWQSAAGRARQA